MPVLMWMAAIVMVAAALLYADIVYVLPLGIIAVLVIRLLLFKQNWALAALIASPNVQYGMWLSPVKVATIVVLPVLIWQGLRRKRTMATGGGWFAAVVIATLFWQLMVDMGLGYMIDPIALMPVAGLLATMLVMWRSVVDLRFLVAHTITQTGALLLLGATMPLFLSTAEMQAEITRHGGLAGQPNLLGTSLSRTSVFAIAILAGRSYNNWLRAVAVAALAGGVYAQFAANSRAGVLAFVAGSATLALLGAEGLARRFMVVASVVSLGTVAVTLAPYSFRERALNIVNVVETTSADRARIDEISSGRATLNIQAIEVIEANPLTGVGSTGFARTVGAGAAVHNAFLAVGAGAGIVAMLAISAGIVGALLVGIGAALRTRHYRVEAAAVVACGAAALVDMMSSPVFMTMQNLWAFMLCAQLPVMVANSKKQQLAQSMLEPVPPAPEPPAEPVREPLAAGTV